MRQRIFRHMTLLLVLAVTLITVSLCIVFSQLFVAQAQSALRGYAKLYATMASASEYPADIMYEMTHPQDLRLTLISPKGFLIYDSWPHLQMKEQENYLEREEVREAYQTGIGESIRLSQSIGSRLLYSAVRLKDGRILRVSMPGHSIWLLFKNGVVSALPIALAVVIIGYFIARKFTKRVLSPIGEVDLASNPTAPYDELAPFVSTIVKHRDQIAKDTERLQIRTGTINAIMDNMHEGVILLDKHGDALSINKSAAQIFGKEERSTGFSAIELIDDVEFVENVQAALAGRRSEISVQKNGREYRTLISPAANIGIVVLLLDVTEKTDTERMRKEFSANVSHELRTPLTSIYGNAEMLIEGVVRDADKPMFYKKIMNEASRLIALIEDIMMLSALDEEKVQGYMQKNNLGELALECKRALERKAEEHNVLVEVEGTAMMTANRSLLYELIFNLLDNAIKYNKPGGQVSLKIDMDEQNIRIHVADNGIGISEADQNRIFERFYRVDRSRSKNSGGTGLGLAIVKHVVLTYKGNIQVNSKLKIGTEFLITFPINC